uniref:DUF4220 domain-containing protein n=1 Tax=Leersia perrieri TaxID=77586 RepID=A0A0D9VPD9_9ORYZ
MAAPPPPPPPALKYRQCNNNSNVNGLVSVEALRIIVETKACFVALGLALAYFLTASRHRLWSSSHLIKGFLFIVTQPMTRFLFSMFAMLLSMPFRNDLYLLWGILLLAGYEGVYTISGYGVSARLSDLAIHEFTRCSNIVLLGLYVRYYSHASQFRYPLWALWALMVAKFLERIVRFKIANKRYGASNTSIVAEYMKHEHDNSNNTDIEAGNGEFSMNDCKYLIVGETKLERTLIDGKAYEAKWTPVTNTVTVAKVWECEGKLLAPEDEGSRKLKDVCLSFALCKLLRRKFAGVDPSASERKKSQKLVFDGLITSKIDSERTFRIVQAELGFARDMSFTKYPILFSCGFPVVSVVLFAATLGVSVWIMVSAILHYRIPLGSTSNLVNGKNVDLIITFVIVGMVAAMDICEFFMHLFSDWTKVMVISEYVRKRYVQCCLLNYILWFVCHFKIAEPIGNTLGQFNLVDGAKGGCVTQHIVKMYHAMRSFVLLNDDDKYRIMKVKSLRPVPGEVKEAICKALMRNRTELTDGQPLERIPCMLEKYSKTIKTAMEVIVVWHVATCHLEKCPPKKLGESPRQVEEWEQLQKSYKVATALSKYCAYLLFYKPKLMSSVGNNSVSYTCKTLVEEATRPPKTGGGGGGGNGDDDNMISKGKVVAQKLLKEHGSVAWKELAEFWSEMLILLAPSGSSGAHEKALGDGGEFITHLWALLYHAAIDDKLSWSSATAGSSTATGESVSTADNSQFQNGNGTGVESLDSHAAHDSLIKD